MLEFRSFRFTSLFLLPFALGCVAYGMPDGGGETPTVPPSWIAPWELPEAEDCGGALESGGDSDSVIDRGLFEAWASYQLTKGTGFSEISGPQIAHYIRIFPDIPKEVRESLLRGLAGPREHSSASSPVFFVLTDELVPLLIAVRKCETLSDDERTQILRNLSRFMSYMQVDRPSGRSWGDGASDIAAADEQRNQQLLQYRIERRLVKAFILSVLAKSPILQKIYEEIGGRFPGLNPYGDE